jgi:hypothetical protein
MKIAATFTSTQRRLTGNRWLVGYVGSDGIVVLLGSQDAGYTSEQEAAEAAQELRIEYGWRQAGVIDLRRCKVALTMDCDV